MADRLVKVDKNGTQYFEDCTCQRCGGAGRSDKWAYTGMVCYECGGSGKSTPHIYKVYTPEYRAKLDAKAAERAQKRLAKAQEEAEDTRKAWLEKNGFDADGNTWCVLGDTYPIKDELKAAGCKFSYVLGWHTNSDLEAYSTKMVNINDIADATLWGYSIDNCKVAEALTPAQEEVKSTSEYIGKVGEKITVEVTLENVASWVTQFGTQHLYSFKDAQGNVLVWKTSTGWIKTDNDNVTSIFLDNGDKEIKMHEHCTLTATIKEHSEYNDNKQTVLTRCKVQ